MDIYRVSVLIWLFLPIPIYWLVRRSYFEQIRKYPLTTSGKIIDVSYFETHEYDWDGSTKATYAFSVAGIEYRGHSTLLGTNHKLGDEICIRYNPEQPILSRRDDLRDGIGVWVVFGILALAIDLGFFVFVISCGLLTLFAGIKLLIRRRLQWQQFAPSAPTFASILFIVLGLSMVVLGVSGLISAGFLRQNILWMLWNHLPLFQS